MSLCSKAKASTFLKLERSSAPTCLTTGQPTSVLQGHDYHSFPPESFLESPLSFSYPLTS